MNNVSRMSAALTGWKGDLQVCSTFAKLKTAGLKWPKDQKTHKMFLFQKIYILPVFFSQPSAKSLSQSPPLHRATETKQSPAAALCLDADSSQSSKTRLEPKEPNSQLEEFRSQIKELLLTVELLKAQQMYSNLICTISVCQKKFHNV